MVDATPLFGSETAFRAIVEGTAAATGERFLALLVQHLATAFNVRYALIAELTVSPDHLRFRAVWTPKGEAIENWLDAAWRTLQHHSFVGQNLSQLFPQDISPQDISPQDISSNDRDLAELQIESYLGVPIVSSGVQIGVLALLDRQPMSHQNAASTLSIFAARVGAELERLQNEAALLQQAECDRLLKNVSVQIHQSLNLEEMLHTTVSAVQQFLHADRVLVYRLKAGEPGELVAAATVSEWTIAPELCSHHNWLDVSYSQSVTSDAGSSGAEAAEVRYDRGEICVVNDARHGGFHPDHLKLLAHLQVQAKLVVPLLRSDTLWGLLAVHQCSVPRQWQAFEIDLLQQLATQVTIAIQQAELFRQVQQQAQREQLLNRISRSISSSLNPQHILQEIVKITGESFGVDRVLIFSVAEQIRAVTEWRSTEQISSMQGLIQERINWSDLVDPDSDFVNHRAFHAPRFHDRSGTNGKALSVLCAPIVMQGNLFGGLGLHMTTQHRTFAPEEIRLLEQIADQAAIALHNAESYEYLEQLAKVRTQELEAEKQVSETANRAKSEFLAVMSHELRTPLNAILGLSELLRQELFGDLNVKQREYIECIHSSGDHLLALIGDILDLSKVEAGKEELVLAPVIVADLCTCCLAMVQEQATEAGLNLTHTIDPQAEMCIADERRLRQMILNLLSNAIKFTPSGDVSLVVQKQPQGIEFTVVDTGIGIALEQLSNLFQPFHQLDSQLDRRYEGTGLGLVLTQRLAQLHGGDVTVESVLHGGSRFTIYLPDAPPAALLVHPSSASQYFTRANNDDFNRTTSQPRQKRILIVEDDYTSAMLIQDYLQVVGYKVEHLADGTNFLERLQQFQPDLVLMDVQLPDGETGLDLLVAMQKQPDLRSIPVVMVTAMAMRGDRERMMAAGATDYLSKPIGLMQLESLLIRCL